MKLCDILVVVGYYDKFLINCGESMDGKFVLWIFVVVFVEVGNMLKCNIMSVLL